LLAPFARWLGLPETKKASTSRLNSSTESGSPGSAPESIKVGYVRRAHGIKGAVVVRPLTDDPDRFVVDSELNTDRDEPARLKIDTVQPHKDGLLISFAGVGSRDAAERLRGLSLLIAPSERRQLGPDEYWPEQLVGLSVVDQDETPLGAVSQVIEGSAQDRLQVTGPAGQFEIPFVAALVTAVDIDAGRVVVDPPAGLIESPA
jgi:16S rRNA processing protein RimM